MNNTLISKKIKSLKKLTKTTNLTVLLFLTAIYGLVLNSEWETMNLSKKVTIKCDNNFHRAITCNKGDKIIKLTKKRTK